MYDEVKKLRREVQELRDELAIMKRKYEDIIYNLDTDNFSSRFVKEQGDMRTVVEVTAEGIKTKVSKEDLDKELEKYSTTEQTAEKIKSEVSKAGKNYATKTEVTQTADSIYMLVASNADLSNAEEIESLEELENCDTNKVYKYITNANKDNEKEVYYQYNHIIEDWQIIDGTIYTVFKQTKDGFLMRGNVKISGDLITDGEITGIAIQSYDYERNVIRMTDGYLYLFPSGASKASLKIGMNTDGDYANPFMIFGAGSGTGSVSVAGAPSVAGAMTFYKSENGFELRFKPKTGGKEQGIWFYDSGTGIEPHIGFGNSALDFQGATVNGLKITFG